jgi:hypothetical protein
MKTYLARFTLNDGEHEHTKYGLIKANSLKTAINYAESQEHESGNWAKDNLTHFDYGDGLTACTCDEVVELTEEQRDVIIELGLAYYMN